MPGWEPWTAQLKRVDRLADMPGCSYEFPALWCGGGDTLMARLDARTGKILWQEPADGFGTTDMSFTQDGVYSLTSGYVNEVPHHTVRRFDAETGKLEAERTVTGSHECHLAEEYLLCLQDGDVIATTTPDQKASRWTVEGRWTEMIQSRAQEPGGDATYVVRAGSSVRYAEEIGELVPGGGEVAWSLKLPPRSAVHSATNDFVYLRSSDTDGTPAFRQLDRRTGTMTSVRLYRSEQPLGVAEGVLYTQRDGGVISAYNLTTEKRLWSVTTLQRELSVPTVGGGRVHFTGLDGTVIVLDQNTGVVLWPRKLPTGSVSEGTGSGRIAARPVVLGDIVIAPAPGGRIRSFLAPAATS